MDRYVRYEDARGSFEGLINSGIWKEVNLVISDEGSVRGGHYHKETTEVFIILEGRIEVVTQKVEGGELSGGVFKDVVKANDVFLIDQGVSHVFHVREKSKWINILSQPIREDAPDIHKAKGR